MNEGVCDTKDRYTGGPSPCRWTMCRGQCEGTGIVPNERGPDDWTHDRCADCGGTGRCVHGLKGRAMDFVFGVYEPLNFAVFWWREYGPFEGAGVVGAFAHAWGDTATYRRLF